MNSALKAKRNLEKSLLDLSVGEIVCKYLGRCSYKLMTAYGSAANNPSPIKMPGMPSCCLWGLRIPLHTDQGRVHYSY